MRYHLEKRSGIWVVFDTQHPKYDAKAPGCSSNHAGCIAWWGGSPVYEDHPDTGKSYLKYWDVPEEFQKKAEELLQLLNNKEQELATLRAKAKAYDEGRDVWSVVTKDGISVDIGVQRQCIKLVKEYNESPVFQNGYTCRKVRVCEVVVAGEKPALANNEKDRL